MMSGKDRPPPMPGASPVFDSGNMRLRKTPSADPAGHLRRHHRHDRGHHPRRRRRAGAGKPAARRGRARGGPVREEPRAGLQRGRLARARPRGVPAPADHAEGLAGAEGRRSRRWPTSPIDADGATFRSLILQKYPDLDIKFVHHAGNSSGVVDGSAAVLLASPDYAKSHGLKPRARVVAMANMGDCPTLMLNAPGPGDPQDPGEGRPRRSTTSTSSRSTRRSPSSSRRSFATSGSTARRSTSTAAPSRSATRSARPARC